MSEAALVVQIAIVLVQCIVAPLLLMSVKALWNVHGSIKTLITKVECFEMDRNRIEAAHSDCRRECKDDRKEVWRRLDQHGDKLADHDRQLGILANHDPRRR